MENMDVQNDNGIIGFAVGLFIASGSWIVRTFVVAMNSPLWLALTHFFEAVGVAIGIVSGIYHIYSNNLRNKEFEKKNIKKRK